MHGPWCGVRVWDMKCVMCEAPIKFFMCTGHGSRVFFDKSEPPWPKHSCYYPTSIDAEVKSAEPARPSGKIAWSTLTGVTFSVEDAMRDGLLHGLVRGGERLDEAMVARIHRATDRPRETMRIEPLSSKSEQIVGAVQDYGEVDISVKWNLTPDSVGLRYATQLFGGHGVTRITLLVDELAQDPEAVDLFSYTLYCPNESLAGPIQRGSVLSAVAVPREILGIGMIWFGADLERIL